jgi:hypothetical protein
MSSFSKRVNGMWSELLNSPYQAVDRLKRAVVISVLLASPCFGQAWSGVIAPSRAIDWSHAGLPSTLPDGETTTNPWTPPTRTQCGSTVGAGTSSATINTLLAACSNGTYLLLGPGSFTVNTTLVLYNKSVTLRGSGPMQTFLNIVSPSEIFMGATGGGGSAPLTSDSNYAAGSVTIKVSGSAPTVGSTAQLTQCDTNTSGNPCSGSQADNGGLFVCGDVAPTCAQQTRGTTYQHQYQQVRITSVTNNSDGTYTLGISPSLYAPNWSNARSARLTWNSPTYNGVGVGLEDLTVSIPSGDSANFVVEMSQTYASWVKGVRFVGSGAISDLWVSASKNGLVVSNYFFPEPYLSGGYAPAMQQTTSSDILVLNNIMHGSTTWEGNGGNQGNVFAYNYGRDTFTAYYENMPFDHAAWSAFDLFEGNQFGGLLDDDTWGAHDINTFFRNYLSCGDPPYQTQNPRGLAFDAFQRFDNAIGNAIGMPGYCTTYQGTGNGSVFRINTGDPLVASTLMRWGNVSIMTQSTDAPSNSGVRFVSSEVPANLPSPNAPFSNPVPSSTGLPCSLYFPAYAVSPCSVKASGGTGFSWWKVCMTWNSFPTSCAAAQTQPFPPVGPEQSGGPHVNGYAYDIPAQVAWQNLPIDTTYQNSYTITSSSWSGGIETLTISGLPNTTHLMGGFQLNGVNSACTAGATINPSNEILMTSSSSTTVSYALGSNPSASCTGTMKFPDVRQFDERVYQNDNGTSAAGPNPPTSLTATVQ